MTARDGVNDGQEPAWPDSVFHEEFRTDLEWWEVNNPAVASYILRIAEAILADPAGTRGRALPLRHALAGCHSRRITGEHRLVYRSSARAIDFLQCRYHY